MTGLLGFSYWAYKKTKPLVELPATTQKTAEVQKNIAADVSASSPQRTTKEENPQEAPPLQNSFEHDSRIHEQQTSVSLCGGPVKPFRDPIQLIKIHAAQLKKTNFLRKIKPDAWGLC